jgi:uncharacterized protein YcbX
MAEGEIFGTISKIAFSPIKGTAQTEVESAYMTPQGLVGDKEYAIVQTEPDQDGVHKWVSQRDKRSDDDKSQSLGILALILPRVSGDALYLSWHGQDQLAVPRDINKPVKRTIQIWDDVIEGTEDQGDGAAEWLSDHLQYRVRLVRAGVDVNRPVSQKWHPNNNRLNFQDSYPLNWLTQESLDELHRRAPNENLPWIRFRANVIVEGSPGWGSEHTYYRGHFGEVPVLNAKPCDRCPVPLIDQETGLRVNGEPLKTLNTYMRWQKPNGKVFVIFGEGALPMGEGEVAVGQPVTILEQRPSPIIYGGIEIKPRKFDVEA